MAKETKASSAAKTEEKQKTAKEMSEGQNGLQYDVRFSSVGGEGNVKGYCTVVAGGEIAIKGVKVIAGTNGLFVAMPTFRAKDGSYVDICNPITKEAREKLNDAVLKEYHAQVQSHQDSQAFDGFDGIKFINEVGLEQVPTMGTMN